MRSSQTGSSQAWWLGSPRFFFPAIFGWDEAHIVTWWLMDLFLVPMECGNPPAKTMVTRKSPGKTMVTLGERLWFLSDYFKVRIGSG